MTWLIAVVSSLALVGLACEDEGEENNLPSSSGGGDGGGGSSGTAGSGGEAGGVGCPESAPISGADCAPEGTMCTYGNTCCQCSNLGECTVWECANPDLNAQDVCPMVSVGTPCGDSTYNPSCVSCEGGVPSTIVCDLNQMQYVQGEITVCQ